MAGSSLLNLRPFWLGLSFWANKYKKYMVNFIAVLFFANVSYDEHSLESCYVSHGLSTNNIFFPQVIQIMIGTFHVFMWYFVMFLYMGQNHGVFGTYEPLTYKTGCALWGVFFILSGIFIIKTERHASHCLVACALSMNILSIIAAIIALILTIIELSQFHSVSYRNYGQAKLGREVSRVLLVSYHLEISIAFVYSLFTCTDLVSIHLPSGKPRDVGF
ncbi:membrane-spanning 4-domains subfamily A member 13 [Loxodonta africana]|uniref:membrane-spanning 4-domains subfamily A member 13 n=1 Tax=Loxodonta africana TaxID=9785 RepID=UPI000C812657|nr:membrane-spanning 4-domains subfamily A member 13 [Loxodonta africana]